MAEQQKSVGPTSITVSEDENGKRLDVFLAEKLEDLSRSKLQQLLSDDAILVNQLKAKPSYRVAAGDVVVVTVPQVQPAAPPRSAPLSIIYEDDDLIVINKAVGMIVHAGAGEHGATLVEALQSLKKPLSHVNIDRPGIVHRLDKDTTGAIVCAKNDATHIHLAKQFEEKTNFREYLTLLDGHMIQETIVTESYIGRDISHRLRMKSYTQEEGGKWAKTHFRRQSTYRHRLTLATAQLETGRTHQIRVHAKDLKLPVVGDALYHQASDVGHLFSDDVRKLLQSIPRQMLHARYLGFMHPTSGEMLAFEAPMPEDMQHLLDALETFKDP